MSKKNLYELMYSDFSEYIKNHYGKGQKSTKDLCQDSEPDSTAYQDQKDDKQEQSHHSE